MYQPAQKKSHINQIDFNNRSGKREPMKMIVNTNAIKPIDCVAEAGDGYIVIGTFGE